MSLVLEEAKTVLRALTRSIDKKADFTAVLQEGDQPGVAVTLILGKQKTTVLIPTEQMAGAAEDSMRRSQLRVTLKRAIDRMMFKPMAIASTKMLRGTPIEGGFFRSQPGGRGGGGRR